MLTVNIQNGIQSLLWQVDFNAHTDMAIEALSADGLDPSSPGMWKYRGKIH
jgi:hypothetical protein